MISPRDVARVVKHAPDRLLHPIRRSRAMSDLAAAGVPDAVLFICLGNINRSAYAAELFRREAARRGCAWIQVRSAGFIGPGRPASELAQRVAQRRGVDLGAHVSRVVERSELAKTPLVVVMERGQARRIRRLYRDSRLRVLQLGDLDPYPIDRRTILDPYGNTEETFEKVFTRLERCVQALSSALFSPTP